MSEIRATTISDAAGTGPITLTKQSAAKAWVNFDGTGSITTRDSFNIATITDNGTGQYGLNYTSAMANANYVGAADSRAQSNAATFRSGLSYPNNTASSGNCRVGQTSSYVDESSIAQTIFGDLA